MHRGFDITLEIKKNKTYWGYHSDGEDLYIENSITIKPFLENLIHANKPLDGTSIQNAWFPLVDADIFISHSHDDLELAIFLAGWLKNEFGLVAFIDACIWEHADKLLMEIDSIHCKNGPNSYSYRLRNHSTSHVHMMLATALNMMMDKTECVFFLNTPNSIQPYGDIDKTESPWIYAEVAATHFLRDNPPDRIKFLLEDTSNFSGPDHLEKAVRILHTVDLSHLNKLSFNRMIDWKKRIRKPEHPLDTLYALHPPKIK